MIKQPSQHPDLVDAIVRYAYHCQCGHVGEETSSCGGLEGRNVLCSQCGRLATLRPQVRGWTAPMGRGLIVTTSDLEREAEARAEREWRTRNSS